LHTSVNIYVIIKSHTKDKETSRNHKNRAISKQVLITSSSTSFTN